MASPLIVYIIAFTVPLFISGFGFPFFIKFMLKKGIFGIDIHKEEQPKVAEMGGIVIIISLIISSMITILVIDDSHVQLMIGIFCITITIAGIIGIIDDFVNLNAILKPVLLLTASIPIIASTWFNAGPLYNSHPYFPLIGETQLTIVYLILLPFVITVPANAVNMIDVFNGSMATTTIIVLIATFIANLIIFEIDDEIADPTSIFVLMIIGVLVAFLIFNRYPARVFGGDSSSLAIGASLGAIAVLGRLEIVIIIAIIPFIMNSFGTISSVKGLLERRKMVRPTKMTKDWKIESTNDLKAPITLVGLVIQKGPLHEKDIVKSFGILTVFSSILAIITAILIRVVI
jgi:UDP-N-acetylglucosamine--dolichyl-phosphate N-acetylglucosaminephosphotransferase